MNGLILSVQGLKAWRFIPLLLCLYLPGLAFAKTPYVFPVEPSDISLQYLFFMFGPISMHSGIKNPNSINVIIGYLTPLMVSAAIIAAAFVGFRSVFVGSSSGHLIGERYSALITPLKVLVGVGSLIPDGTGYAPIHKWLFWMVINGIGLANQLWGVMINEYSMGYGWDQNVEIDSGSDIDWMMEQLLYVAMTKSYLEQAQPGTYVEVYPQAGEVYRMCDISVAAQDGSCNSNNQVVLYPVLDPGDSYNTSMDAQDFSLLMNSFLQKVIHDPLIQYGAYQILSDENNISEEDILNFFGQEYCYSEIMNYQMQMQQYLQPYARELDNKPLDENQMMQEGWMSAAFYYWKLWAGGGGNPLADQLIEDFTYPRTSINIPNSILSSTQYKSIYDDSSAGISVSDNIKNYVKNLYTVKNTAPSSNSGYEKIAGTASSDGLKSLLSVSGTNFLIHSFIFTNSDAAGYRDIYDLNYDFTKDRFGSFIRHNAKVIVHIINFMQSLIIILFVIVVFAALNNGMNPGLLIILHLICTTLFLITPLLVLIATTSLMGSMYASVIPGMIFGAGAFGWFVKIVEMIISAPLAAIAMIMPSEDETSAITHVLMQLLMAITRPALMLIGFVLAAKLCQISIMFVGGAFNYLGETLSGVTSSGGMLFLVMMYEFMTMTTLAFCVRAFGFINIIPDTVFSVIRLQSQDGDTDQLVAVFERSGQEGSEQIGQVISMLNGVSKLMLTVVPKEGDM